MTSHELQKAFFPFSDIHHLMNPKIDFFPLALTPSLKIDSLCKIKQCSSLSGHSVVFVHQQTHPGLELLLLTYLTAESSSLTGRNTKAGSHSYNGCFQFTLLETI